VGKKGEKNGTRGKSERFYTGNRERGGIKKRSLGFKKQGGGARVQKKKVAVASEKKSGKCRGVNKKGDPCYKTDRWDTTGFMGWGGKMPNAFCFGKKKLKAINKGEKEVPRAKPAWEGGKTRMGA